MLVHQAGSVRVGEVVRYTLTYTPAADPILPTPAELYVTVKNTSAVPLRAAYLHGPYTLYTACYPASFDPDSKYDRRNVDGTPQFEPYLKAGGSWDAVITVPQHLRRTPQGPFPSEAERGGRVTWVIEIISQVIFSVSAAVHFELLVSRDGKPIDLLPRMLSANGLPPPAQLHDHWSPESRGYQVSATKGVYSGAITLLVDDTASLWNTPPFSSLEQKPVVKKMPTPIPRDMTSTAEVHEPSSTIMDEPKKKKIHLVILTHGLHSNLGADMLYLKESIDRAARSASEEANGGDDYEQVIVRGFPGNAARTERGIQYLGKRLAKYVLLMTYPDQPYLPPKNSKAKASTAPLGGWKEVHGAATHSGEADLHHHSYKITSISFIGHSLGGLVQTYAIAYIQKYSPQFFELIKPVNFIALATPFLGLSSENPVYVRFALDLGLVGRTGQDLGLSWTAPRVRGGLGGIIGSKSNEHGKPPEPGSKPLLRILPSGTAHEALRKFQRRTVYSNVVNDGIVPLRTSCLLFLDWKALDRVEKANRGNGLVGTMAEWGWAELTGASSKSLRTSCSAPEALLGGDGEEGERIDRGAVGSAGYGLAENKAIETAIDPDPSQFLQQPHESRSSVASSQPSSPGPLSSFLSIFRVKETRTVGHKQAKIYRQSQTITTLHQPEPLGEPSSPGQRRAETFGSHEEGGVNTPPKTTFFESAGDILMPPLPPIEFIIDPAARPRTIFHDRIYHPEDIPPPRPTKRRTLTGNSSSVENLKTGQSSSSKLQETHEGGLKVEERIARAYHRDLSWRKVLVRLEPDAHNNIIVRRMLTNAYGWPVVKHLVESHFVHSPAMQPHDITETPVEKVDSPNVGMVSAIGEAIDPTTPETTEATPYQATSGEASVHQATDQ